MTLVDIANGKQRHVPYRDSRLTFLLQVINCNFFFYPCHRCLTTLLLFQDSLGGNSKTTIIANVSPSVWYKLTFLFLVFGPLLDLVFGDLITFL